MITDVGQQLIKLGLSKNQAQIYILLAQNGEMRIQEIASLTKIPRSSVYEHLKVLQKSGLIERIIGDNFIRIKAYPLDSMRHNLEQKINELRDLTSGLDGLEKALSLMPGLKSNSTTVRYYKGVAGGRQLLWNSLKASNTVYVYSAFGRSQFVGEKFYMDFVSESFTRGIQELGLINPTKRAFDLIKRDMGTPMARTNGKNIKTIDEGNILIKGETFIYNDIYAQVYLDADEINGFEIESSHFVETQRSIFETLWAMAKPL